MAVRCGVGVGVGVGVVPVPSAGRAIPLDDLAGDGLQLRVRVTRLRPHPIERRVGSHAEALPERSLGLLDENP